VSGGPFGGVRVVSRASPVTRTPASARSVTWSRPASSSPGSVTRPERVGAGEQRVAPGHPQPAQLELADPVAAHEVDARARARKHGNVGED
jgi:hypothetical protein